MGRILERFTYGLLIAALNRLPPWLDVCSVQTVV
jgi:hypothetical protein